MKILVSYRAAPRIRGWETGAMVARAFRRLGHEVYEYGNEYQTNNWLVKSPDSDEFIVLNERYQGRELYSGYIWTSDMLRGEYDLILNMECNDPDVQYFELTRVKAAKRAVWHFDTSYYMDIALSHINAFQPSHVFMANWRNYEWELHRKLRMGAGVSYLPYAADPRHIDSNVKRPIDVGLVGSDRRDRRKLIHTLRERGVRAELISDVFREDYVRALASCKIVINENPPEGGGLLNMRSFEAPAAGAFLLTGDPEIELHLKPGMHCEIYKSPGHAADICNRLLSDHASRIKIAIDGQYRIREDHMYDNRAKEILDVMGF